MVARPATIPVTIPSTLGLPYFTHSAPIHVREATDALICVTSIAMPAAPSDATALPALNPNQPTHSMHAPVTVIGRLCGGMGVSGNPRRLPITSAATTAATPAVT